MYQSVQVCGLKISDESVFIPNGVLIVCTFST